MEEIENNEKTIYNCHVHIFTDEHVPELFVMMFFKRRMEWLARRLMRLLKSKRVSNFAVRLGRLLSWIPFLDRLDQDLQSTLERYKRLLDKGQLGDQAIIFDEVKDQYPPKTRFIVLPMNMEHMDLGNVQVGIDEQHAQLARLARQDEYRDHLIPFFAVDPREEGIVKKVEDQFSGQDNVFRGIKIYPSLGYMPHDQKLMDIYKICVDKRIPVMSHCSTGGVWKFGLSEAQRANYNHPRNYEIVLDKYPNLHLCLAHFGGGAEWRKHIGRKKPVKPANRAWVRWITDMIKSGKYPNLYTDVSYTIFENPGDNLQELSFFDYLNVLLTNERLQKRVLFGTDYYMVELEVMSEREVSTLLRSRLGNQLYFQIANTNPERYLGIGREKTESRKKTPRRMRRKTRVKKIGIDRMAI